MTHRAPLHIPLICRGKSTRHSVKLLLHLSSCAQISGRSSSPFTSHSSCVPFHSSATHSEAKATASIPPTSSDPTPSTSESADSEVDSESIYIDPSPYTASTGKNIMNPNANFFYKLLMSKGVKEQAARITIAPLRHLLSTTLQSKPIIIRSRDELFPVSESLPFLATANGPCPCTQVTSRKDTEIRDLLDGKLTLISITQNTGTASFVSNWFNAAQEIAVAYETGKLTHETATLLPDQETMSRMKASQKGSEGESHFSRPPFKFIKRPHNLANVYENRLPYLSTQAARPDALIAVPNDGEEPKEPVLVPVAQPKIEHSLQQASSFLQTLHLQIIESHLLLWMKSYILNNVQAVVPKERQDSTYVAIERAALDSLFGNLKGEEVINALGLRTYGSLGLTLLIDSKMRIRWRACGPLCEDDVAALRSVIPSLIHEHRLEKRGQDLVKLKQEKGKNGTFSQAVGYSKNKKK